MRRNYDLYPAVRVDGATLNVGWKAIAGRILADPKVRESQCKLIVIECYTGIIYSDLLQGIEALKPDRVIDSRTLFKSEGEVLKMTWPDVTDDRIFGYMTRLHMQDFLDQEKIKQCRDNTDLSVPGTTVVFGPGASLVFDDPPVLVYADMARWEIQLRMRRHLVTGLGVDDHQEEFSHQYKRGYFVDWRVCDRLKDALFGQINFFLDTNAEGSPKLISSEDFRDALAKTSRRPFRVVPYFDPGPWGGQWMKEVCGLDPVADNYAWCFDCVPEENSLVFNIDGVRFETPAINLVLFQSENLLGNHILQKFGREFPIRFDFLDTMGGGNLSLQVHPLKEYIREKFGMDYTQDESYYMLDAGPDGCVYLGIRDDTDPVEMISNLKEANEGGPAFEAEKFINVWPAKKHDHFLIPAGTIHCSGKNSMVLEISATPYIFTFKLWDWARLGLDGKPRPINIEHGAKVIQWNRRTGFTRDELINRVIPIASGDGWREERTGLHELEFLETRRHWFSRPVTHHTGGTVNVLNLVEGSEAIITSPHEAFEPFVVHYAETFIIPASVGEYSISPHGDSLGKEIATIKCYVRV